MTKAAALSISNNQQITNIKKPRQPQQQVQAPVRVGKSDLVTNKNKTRTRREVEPPEFILLRLTCLIIVQHRHSHILRHIRLSFITKSLQLHTPFVLARFGN